MGHKGRIRIIPDPDENSGSVWIRIHNNASCPQSLSLGKLVLAFSVQITGSDEKLASLVSLLVLTFQPKVFSFLLNELPNFFHADLVSNLFSCLAPWLLIYVAKFLLSFCWGMLGMKILIFSNTEYYFPLALRLSPWKSRVVIPLSIQLLSGLPLWEEQTREKPQIPGGYNDVQVFNFSSYFFNYFGIKFTLANDSAFDWWLN